MKTANGYQCPNFFYMKEAEEALEIFKLEVLATSRTPKNQILLSDMSISSSLSLTKLRAASRSIATLIRRSRTAWLSSRDVSKDEKYNFEVLFKRYKVEDSNKLLS